MKLLNTALRFTCLTALLSCSSMQKHIDCSKFRKGKFELHSKYDNSVSLIQRNDSIQTEYNKTTGHIAKAKIKWKSECEYELQYFQQTTNSTDTIIPFLQTRPLITKIIKATKQYYVFTASMADTDKTLTDTLFIVK